MPSNVTDWGASQYLSIIHGLVSQPSNYYIGLCTEEPGTGVDGSILAEIEPQDPAYHRVAYPMGPSSWSDPEIGQYLANLNPIDFGIPIADWGIITHFVLCNSLIDGEVYSYGEFDVPVYVSSTYVVVIEPGSITIAIQNIEPSIVGQ